MKTTYFIFCFLIFSDNKIFAQSYTGKILNIKDYTPATQMSVTNKRTLQTAYSDKEGRYKITAHLRDTLFLSHSLYQFSKIIITKNDSINIAYVIPRTNELEEVTVSTDLAKYRKDSIETRIIYKKQIKDAQHKNKYSLNNGLMIEGGFTSLAYAISGKGKKNKRFLAQLQEDEKYKVVFLRYNPNKISDITGLNEENAAIFIKENPMPYQFAHTASNLELKNWIKKILQLGKNIQNK